MLNLLRSTALAIAAVVASSAVAFASPTVKVLVAQEDWDKHSLKRNSRIQNAILNAFNATLNAPAYKSYIKKYGLEGLDVYDETAVTLDFYHPDRVRRSDEELIALSRQIKNPPINVLTLYTVYAKAVTDPYTKIAKLQMSLNYRVLDVRSGRFLGGDNLDIDTSGVPFTGCAAGLYGQAPDPHCVAEFVAEHGERLARDAGNKLAIQLAALVGPHYGNAPVAVVEIPAVDGEVVEAPAKHGEVVEGETVVEEVIVAKPKYSKVCANIPTTFLITFRGFGQKHVNFIEENMAHWKCVLHLDTVDSSFSQVTYEYKTRADAVRILRNIRLMSELMGLIVDPKTEGRNEIVVTALPLRHN